MSNKQLSKKERKVNALQPSPLSKSLISVPCEHGTHLSCEKIERIESCPTIISGPKQSKQISRRMSASFNPNMLLRPSVLAATRFSDRTCFDCCAAGCNPAARRLHIVFSQKGARLHQKNAVHIIQNSVQWRQKGRQSARADPLHSRGHRCTQEHLRSWQVMTSVWC